MKREETELELDQGSNSKSKVANLYAGLMETLSGLMQKYSCSLHLYMGVKIPRVYNADIQEKGLFLRI